MIFPNKLINFNDSILAKSIYILDQVSKNNFQINTLYGKVNKHFEDINEYLLALDVLYALNKIEYNKDFKVIKYVKKNNL
jgi:hypothetical protein